MAANDLADNFKINHSIRAREVRLVGDNVTQVFTPFLTH